MQLAAGNWPAGEYQVGSGDCTAVGGQDGARNHARGGTCQKDHSVGDFARLGVASQRRQALLEIGSLAIRRI